MNITIAMLRDVLTHRYPTLETTLYGPLPIRGIKLFTTGNEQEPSEQLILKQEWDEIFLRYGSMEVQLDTNLPLEKRFNALLDSYNQLRDWDMATHRGRFDPILTGYQPVHFGQSGDGHRSQL